MTVLPRDCVVDASVGIKLVLAEVGSVEARALFAPLSDDDPPRLAVPDLFFIECANILWKNTRRGTLSVADGQTGLASLIALALATTPTAHLAPRALEIAAAHDVSAYDAAYLALAERLDLPLVTADTRLARSVAASSFRVVLLPTAAE